MKYFVGTRSNRAILWLDRTAGHYSHRRSTRKKDSIKINFSDSMREK